ncbi:unnamed protein product [Arabis nemorensis]|uniref:RRM domain-containing protein n=1 Tax=Arabis nemorensis TaxID=586526 RepID=A0A565BLV8_9BRAS|nr:unnamed protein product [Arabis nemorensis]
MVFADTTEGFAEQKKGRADLLEIKFDQANLIKAKDAAVRPKTLSVANLSPETEISVLISDIIDFFKHVGKAVRVQLFVNASGEHKCCGLVEFASSNEAKKALEKKNGEYLHDHKIFLHVATTAPQHLYNEDDFKTNPILKKPKTGGFCGKKITFPDDDDYPQQERLPIEEDETPTDFVEEVLFVANLSPQTEIPHIIDFFKDIGNVQVRLTVNQECKHVGHGFVEFESSYEAKKALENKNGEYLHDHKIFLHVARTAPYPPRPKYNLADKLCYEDYLRRVSLLIEEDETIERLCKTPVFLEAVAVTKKTLYVFHFSRETNISHIIDFFKDVGGVVNVRLNVNHMGGHGGYGYVEFASAYKAKKALQKKNGKYLRDRKIVLELAKMVPSKYEDYLRQENRLIKEDEAVEGLDETPGFVEAQGELICDGNNTSRGRGEATSIKRSLCGAWAKAICC